MMKLSMNLLIFPMVKTFSWGGRGGIKLLRYHQMTKIPLLFFVIDFSSPFKIFKLQNFTSVPPPTSSNHIVGRRVLTPLFYEDPLYISKLPFFKFCPTPLPCCLQPPALLLILLCYFFGWMGDHATFDVLFYSMISWMYICRALGSWCMFYATRCQVYWVLTCDVVFCWYSNLISHTQTHMHKDTHSPLRGQ